MSVLELLNNNTQGCLIAIACLLIGYYLYQLRRFYSGVPPGPKGFPIVGYLPLLRKPVHDDFDRLAKIYGDVFSLRAGSKLVVIFNSYDAVKEAFVKYGDFFSGKPDDFLEEFGDSKSIFVTEGDVWRDQRRFLLSSLRDFGFGKTRLQEHIQEEAQLAVEELLKVGDQPHEMKKTTTLMASNVISYLIYGRRFSYDDKEFQNTLAKMFEPVKFSLFNVALVMPILKYLPDWLTGINVIKDMLALFFKFADDFVERHEKTYDENNLRDLVDVYIMKFREVEDSGIPEGSTIYTKAHLRANIVGLFSAGVDTTASTTAWTLKLLAAYPEVQKRLQKEIDEVIGKERCPSMEDRIKMPYTEAVLLEVNRYISLLPTTFFHRATSETYFRGYRIPKHASILANFWSAHHDPKIWTEPDKFNPERFIGEDGKITKLRENVLAFAIGKRNCLGESLAKMELFIFLTTCLQKLSFHPPKDGEFLTAPKLFYPFSTLKSYAVCVSPRDNSALS